MLQLFGIIILFAFLFVLIIGLAILSRIVKGFFSIGRKMTGNSHRNRDETSHSSGTHSTSGQNAPKKKKIFDEDEGEYVDFEEIKDP